MKTRLLPLAILLLAALAPAVQAAPDPNPSVPQWIEARYGLEFTSLTAVTLTGTLDVRQYEEDGDVYSAQDIANSFAGANRYGKKVGDAFVTDLEAGLKTQVEEVLATAFPNAASREVTLVEVDRASLSAARVDAYDPPVRVRIEASIVRSLASLGLDGYSPEAIDAVFDAGAAVRTDFSLSTKAGYENTFVIQAPPGFGFSDPTDGVVSAGGRTFTLVRDNTLGTADMLVPVSLRLRDPTATVVVSEDIATSVDLKLGDFKGAKTLPIQVEARAAILSVSVEERFAGVLPESVSLAYLSAESIRALKATGVIAEQAIADANAALVESVREDLAGSLKAEVTVKGGMVPASLEPDATGPIAFDAQASAAYPLEGTGAENLDLALRIGAQVSFELPLFASPTQDTTFTLQPPAGVSVLEAPEGELAPGGKRVTFLVPAAGEEGATERKVSMTLAQDGAPTFTAAKAELGVVVDLKDLDISIGKAMGGDMGDLVIEVKVTGNLGVLEIPDDLRASLDSRVSLQYLPSDAIRLLRERGVLSEENLTKLEQEMLDQVKANLGAALGADVAVTGGFDRATLDPRLVSEPVSGDKPIVFNAQTSFRKSLSGAPPAQPQAAIALYTQQQSFTLPKVQGLDTAYTVILPYGLAVTDLQVEGGSKETGQSADGRDQFTVRPSDDEAKATVSMAVTPSFVVAKFWPILLLAVMILVLLVGSPVAFLVMRRRGKDKTAAAPQGKAK